MDLILCKLCDRPKELKHSHVIGRSIFRSTIGRGDKHYGIIIDHEKDKIVRSTDQWATLMLCNECENFLNSRYENYSLWVLKNKQNGVRHQTNPHYYSIKNINQKRMMMYIISIFWRAAVSEHKVFSKVSLEPEMSEYLKKSILGKIDINTKVFSVRISKLFDEANHYSEDVLKSVITNIHPRVIENGVSYIMLFSGFFFEIFFGNLNADERFGYGFLRKNKIILNMPYQNILSIPEVHAAFSKMRFLAERDIKELDYLNLTFDT